MFCLVSHAGFTYETVSACDSQTQAISKVVPKYPIVESVKPIEDYVIVEFTIDVNGNVTEPIVIDSKPKKLFDRSALLAISKWKYKNRKESCKWNEKISYVLEE